MFRHGLPSGFLLGLLLLAGWAAAEDFWLRPTHYRVPAGTTVVVQRLVGQQLAGRPWSGTSRRLARLLHYAPNDTLDLTGLATLADTLHTALELNEPGTHLLSLETTEAQTTLSGPDFMRYLLAEELENIVALRQKRGQQDKPARETYHRCAKTLVQVGSAVAGPFRAHVGAALELVPDQNPYAARPGSVLTVQVLEHGRPVRGQRVVAYVKLLAGPATPVQVQRLYTSPEGRVLVRLPLQPAELLLSSVRMHPHPTAQVADYQSVWATLTFGINQPYKR